MEKVYQEIVDFIISEGKRISQKAGKIKDIGVKKQFLTEEDSKIEQGLKEIIREHSPNHGFCAEEENEQLPDVEDIWFSDPISGTQAFIMGIPRYAIVIAHTRKNKVLFGAVYMPGTGELFTAFNGKGAFLNGEKISVSNKEKKIAIMLINSSKYPGIVEKTLERTKQFDVTQNNYGQSAMNCEVARGFFDGAIFIDKDSFPMFALSLIVQEAGGAFTNLNGDSNIHFNDRIFVCGNKKVHKTLLKIAHEVFL